MISADEKTRISDEIEALFENLSIEDVAELLVIQVASLIAQGSTSAEEAQDFLDDIRNDVSDYLLNIDFESLPADDDAIGESEKPQQH